MPIPTFLAVPVTHAAGFVPALQRQWYTVTSLLNSMSLAETRYAPTYGATVSIDMGLGRSQAITVTDANAFTVSAPTNVVSGQRLTIMVRNTSGGAMGVITWDAVFKMAAWTNPATANSRSITFLYDGTNWVEVSRTPADVPN